MAKSVANRQLGLVFIEKFREYGVRVLDGGTGFIQIHYCPWCGCKLSESLRDEWFSRIEAMGFEVGDSRIPEEFLNDKWWKLNSPRP